MRRPISFLPLIALFGAACAGTLPSEGETKTGVESIVGGTPDTTHNYVVLVGGCTGTVISRRTVITAGHCFNTASSVKFGPSSSQIETTINVIAKKRHPLFEDLAETSAFELWDHDLTVLKLASNAPVAAQSAPLLRQTMTSSPTFVGPEFVFVGYGQTQSGGFGTRRRVNMPLFGVGPFNASGNNPDVPNDGVIPASGFYYSVPGKNTCFGDSGGPAFYIGPDGVEYHAGVTSGGDTDCALDGTDGRTDQPEIDAFIQAAIDEFEGNDACRSDGACNDACNTGGQVVDPDCAAKHCGADGICARACVVPVDPDCVGGSGGSGGTGGSGGSGGSGAGGTNGGGSGTSGSGAGGNSGSGAGGGASGAGGSGVGGSSAAGAGGAAGNGAGGDGGSGGDGAGGEGNGGGAGVAGQGGRGGASSGSSGGSSAGQSGSSPADPSESDDGCSCSVPTGARPTPGALALFGLLLARPLRKRRLHVKG